MPHMPSAASLCRATSRRARALFLALTLPQHPRPPDCDAIYEKFVFASRARHPAHIAPVGYPTEGDREHYLDVNVELVGTIDRRTGYPIQNLRASTKGTVVRVGQSFPVKERQEVAFLGLWWLVDEVQYDLTSVNPQAAGMGDFMKNAVVEVTLVGSGRAAE